MHDRELLEMAAKAAGIELLWPLYMPGADEVPMLTKSMKDTVVTWWSPLADDGDALRLHVFCYQTYGTEYIENFNEAFDEELSRNPSYATAGFRRAATMTAAKMGKAMP